MADSTISCDTCAYQDHHKCPGKPTCLVHWTPTPEEIRRRIKDKLEEGKGPVKPRPLTGEA